MKKLLSLCLTMALLLVSIPLGAFVLPVSAESEGYYTYEVVDGGATITGVDEFISGDIIIPDTLGGYPVTSIAYWGFFGCDLTSITIPAGVTSLEGGFVVNCNVTDIYVHEDNPFYTSVDGVLFSKDKTTLIQYPCGREGAYTVPDGVTSIDGAAFYWCGDLTGVTFPDGLISIGGIAFEDCIGLKNLVIPDSVTEIGAGAFAYCAGLESVTLSDGITSIPFNVFEICSGLRVVYYRGSEDQRQAMDIDYNNDFLTNATWYYNSCIGAAEHTYDGDSDADCNVCGDVREVEDAPVPDDEAYYIYEVIDGEAIITGVDESISGDITIPDTLGGYPVTAIGMGAFAGCSSVTSITVHENVTSIGDWAFLLYDTLVAIHVDENNPSYASQDGVLFSKDMTVLIQYPVLKSGTYIVPEGVTKIGDSAFQLCSLTGITLPNSLITIDDSAFDTCYGLTSLVIPDGVISIGDYAFSYCYYLKSVTIPDSATTIGEFAFFDCNSLTDVYYRGNESERQVLDIGDNNGSLTNATWYYNSCIGAAEHTYDGDSDADCNVCGDVREVETTHTPGDINGDGSINNRDSLTLIRYLNEWDVDVVEAALDINGDGSLNNRDTLILTRYLNDWDVTIY